jgi:hypothetical protein
MLFHFLSPQTTLKTTEPRSQQFLPFRYFQFNNWQRRYLRIQEQSSISRLKRDRGLGAREEEQDSTRARAEWRNKKRAET